jgi:two-component system chemotaxis sensor kinase CheA
MEDFERELKEDFLEESLQLLEDSEQAFLALENNKESTELLDAIFRLAHNLKGTSRAVGFGEVAEFTHEMENLILKLKTGEMEVSDAIVSLLLECNDHITHMINTLRDDLDATFDSSGIIGDINAALSGNIGGEATPAGEAEPVVEPTMEEIPNAAMFEEEEAAEVPAAEAFEEEVSFDDANFEEDAGDEDAQEISAAALEALKELGLNDETLIKELELKTAKPAQEDTGLTVKKGEEVVSQVEPPKPEEAKPENVTPIAAAKKPAAAPPSGGGGAKKASKKSEDESIRVALSRVEKLNNVVGELVILQTVLDQRRFTAIQDGLANKSISQLGKLSKEIQEISMSLRMIPLKATFQKMNRIVRDTSKTLDKKVNLMLKGEDTEIDKTVLENLADPLVHIIRNAVDHGLESTEDRIKAGKDEIGNIELKAYHEGNNLVIEVKDDGGGIKADIIRNKAIEKGLLNPNKEISDHDAIQYIFAPGFSTKEQVTEVSGRGVGMDVVKTNLEKMSGSIRVYTEVGTGSTFKISLPLTMAIIEGMIIRIGEERYIIPLSQVHESLKPTKKMINEISGFGQCLNLRGEVLPLFSIGKTLGRDMDEGETSDKIAIIVHHTEFNFAVLVDDILHQQQVVIKTLGDEIKGNQGFMGSSILGDGRPSFILDLNELYSNSLRKNVNTFKEFMAKAV